MKGGLAATLLLFPCITAAAQNINSFELEFQHHQVALSDHTELDTDAMGIRYSEGSRLPLQLSLALGREAVSHDNDPVSLGFQPDGYYASITLNTATPRLHHFQSGASFSYGYHWSGQTFNQQRLELDWHQAEARLWAALHLNDWSRLHACATVIDVDGTQRLNGTAPSHLDFKHDKRNGLCGGVEFETGDGGYFGVELESRQQRGGRLYFGRRYNGF